MFVVSELKANILILSFQSAAACNIVKKKKKKKEIQIHSSYQTLISNKWLQKISLHLRYQ